MADVDQQPASSTLSIGEAEFQRLQVRENFESRNETRVSEREGVVVSLHAVWLQCAKP